MFSTALDAKALDQIFRKARTHSNYLDRPVTDDVIKALYDLWKWAPTSANQQPLRVLWCKSKEAKEMLADHCYSANADKVREAPLSAVLGMEYEFSDYLPRMFPHTDARLWYGEDREMIEQSAFRNSSLQGGYLIIAARALGLDTNPISGFSEKGVNYSFFSDSTVKVNFIMTLGYGDASRLPLRGPRFDFHETNEIL